MSTIPMRLALVLCLAMVSAIYAQDPKPSVPPAMPTSDAAWTTKTFDVKYIDPEAVRDVFSSQSYVMDANRELKVLTARGTPAFLKDVEDTIKRLDVAPPAPADTEITVYLLAAAAQAPIGTKLPAELSALAKELPAKLADMQMFRVRVGQPGETTSAPLEGATGVTLTRIQVDSTAINPRPKGDIVSVNGLKVWINIPVEPSPTTNVTKTTKNDADVTADIDVMPNEAVVVAKVGVEKPLAVVVRVGVVK
jgi:hypothetical protein